MSKNTEQRKAITEYLAAIERANAPKPRGRQRTATRIGEEITQMEEVCRSTMDPVRRLEATQAILDLHAEAEEMAIHAHNSDPKNFEDAFITHAAEFAAAKNITAAAFLNVGVSRGVLKRADLL